MNKNKKVIFKEKDEKSKITYEERLIASGAIDLRDNCIIEDLGNGYSRNIPIDRTKLFKGLINK